MEAAVNQLSAGTKLFSHLQLVYPINVLIHIYYYLFKSWYFCALKR